MIDRVFFEAGILLVGNPGLVRVARGRVLIRAYLPQQPFRHV